MSFTTLELFAGAGGMALGFEKAGFDVIALIEREKDAAGTLKRNRPHWNVMQEDIADVSCMDLEKLFHIRKGELDVLSGGAPCQPFSYAGRRRGLEDARGTLFWHFAVFLQKLCPKMFLFENVKGLLTHDAGRTYQTMADIFEQSGYAVQRQVLNAWDYGVPQRRERLITVGIHKSLLDLASFHFPIPQEERSVLKDVLQYVPESPGSSYSKKKQAVISLVPQGGNWKDIDLHIAKEYMKGCWESGGGRTGILRRMSMDEPMLTVLTSPSQKQTDRCHPLEDRPFTVRENARCQTFPDDWQFTGSVASQYRQVGNAVPVNLACAVALEMKKTLDGIGI